MKNGLSRQQEEIKSRRKNYTKVGGLQTANNSPLPVVINKPVKENGCHAPIRVVNLVFERTDMISWQHINYELV